MASTSELTFNNSNNTSLRSGLDPTGEVWKGNSFTEQIESKWITRTFIIYLEPSIDAPAVRCLATVRNFLGEQIGYDDSHLYPLHCSLTSFFDVRCPVEDSPRINEVFEKCLGSIFLDNLMASPMESVPLRTSGDVLHGGSEVSCRVQSRLVENLGSSDFRGKVHNVSSGALAYRSSVNVSSTRVSTTASESRRIDNDDFEEEYASMLMSSSQGYSVGRHGAIEMTSPVTKTSVLRPSNVLFHVQMKSNYGVTAPVPQRDKINEHLKLVHVTADGSIILPLKAAWLTEEPVRFTRLLNSRSDSLVNSMSGTAHCVQVVAASGISMEEPGDNLQACSRLTLLCSSIENTLRSVVPQAQVAARKGSASIGIRPKAARHMTLLNNKGFVQDDFEKQLASIAGLLDKAACTGPLPLMWDIVVNEVKSWGSFQGINNETNCTAHPARHTCFAEPHDFVDVVRVTHVAMTKP